ncbi:MAG: DUF4177 domain-containing protein [Albidovulum sp.]
MLRADISFEVKMQCFEYQVIPAPLRGEKKRGVKTTSDRFAQTMADIMNTQARDGWEYLRSDTLPSEERAGFTGRRTIFVNVLVFRRAVTQAANAPMQRLVLSPAAQAADVPQIKMHEEGRAPKLGAARTKDLSEPQVSISSDSA